MSILLPPDRVASATPRPVRFSGNQESPLGGPSLPVSRLGDRWALDVTTTPLQAGSESRTLTALLTQSLDLDGRMTFPQPGLDIGISTLQRVDGGGQTGSFVSVKDLPPGYIVRYGQFFSINHNGVEYLHMSTVQATADGAGKAIIPIWPMLRFITIGNEYCNFNAPWIEGIVSGFDAGWTQVRAKTQPLRFTITERQ